MNRYEEVVVEKDDGSATLTTTGDKMTITPALPIAIKRYGITGITTAIDDASFTLALDHRPTAGSDSDRTEEATLSPSGTGEVEAGDELAGRVVRSTSQTTATDGSTVEDPPSGPLVVNPGEQAVLEVTDASNTTGAGTLFVEYFQLPFDGTLADVTEVDV